MSVKCVAVLCLLALAGVSATDQLSQMLGPLMQYLPEQGKQLLNKIPQRELDAIKYLVENADKLDTPEKTAAVLHQNAPVASGMAKEGAAAASKLIEQKVKLLKPETIQFLAQLRDLGNKAGVEAVALMQRQPESVTKNLLRAFPVLNTAAKAVNDALVN